MVNCGVSPLKIKEYRDPLWTLSDIDPSVKDFFRGSPCDD